MNALNSSFLKGCLKAGLNLNIKAKGKKSYVFAFLTCQISLLIYDSFTKQVYFSKRSKYRENFFYMKGNCNFLKKCLSFMWEYQRNSQKRENSQSQLNLRKNLYLFVSSDEFFSLVHIPLHFYSLVHDILSYTCSL